VNQYESASLREALFSEGWHEVSRGKRADVSLVNTCIVTQRASYQSRQAIRKALRENPSGMVCAIGCYAQVFPEELSRIPGLHLIAGNTVKARLPEYLKDGINNLRPRLVLENFKPDRAFEFLPIKSFLGRTRAFLKIQDGCQSFCSYCVVPFARGPLRSLVPSRVILMLESMAREGYREVVLTGIHLGKYGIDLDGGLDLKGLLRLIKGQGLPMRIRLSSIEPNEIDPELIEMMATGNWLCRHFHIPLQSGDNGILRRMNRRYTARDFAERLESIHTKLPLAAIGVDAMVGFPGEDQQAYENTYALIDDLPVSYLHVFPFSPRRGTAAAAFSGQVKQEETKKRAARLRRLGQKKRESFYRSCLGEDFLVLAEGWHSKERQEIKGLSDNYLPVVFGSSRLIKNRMVPVRAESLGKTAVIGRPTGSHSEG
jgi:threonylcarbamoyladenosine tRNA methylthiotransferase MtaB